MNFWPFKRKPTESYLATQQASWERIRVERENVRERMNLHNEVILSLLDDDIAAPWRGMKYEDRVEDAVLLLAQQIRMQRRLLEQLQDGDKGAEGSGNG